MEAPDRRVTGDLSRSMGPILAPNSAWTPGPILLYRGMAKKRNPSRNVPAKVGEARLGHVRSPAPVGYAHL